MAWLMVLAAGSFVVGIVLPGYAAGVTGLRLTSER